MRLLCSVLIDNHHHLRKKEEEEEMFKQNNHANANANISFLLQYLPQTFPFFHSSFTSTVQLSVLF